MHLKIPEYQGESTIDCSAKAMEKAEFVTVLEHFPVVRSRDFRVNFYYFLLIATMTFLFHLHILECGKNFEV